jgi:hypothetical protein
MIGVAIAALNFSAIRAFYEFAQPTADFLLFGGLPMANVLAIGIMIGKLRARSRPFLLGFEIFGAIALLTYVLLSTLSDGGELDFYLEPLIGSLIRTMLAKPRFIAIPVIVSVGAVVLTLPQLAFALLGGFLSSRFRMSITRR